MEGAENFFSSSLSASLQQLKQSVSFLACDSLEHWRQARNSTSNGLRSVTQDDVESLYSSSSNASTRRVYHSPSDDEISSQDSQSTVGSFSVDSIFSDKGLEWHWVKPEWEVGGSKSEQQKELDKGRERESAMIQERQESNMNADFARRNCTLLDKNQNINRRILVNEEAEHNNRTQLLAINDEGSICEQDSMNEHEGSSVESKRTFFPLKWPNISYRQKVEEQSYHSDSTIEERFLETSGQTTFSNPVFDLHPLEGNRMSPDVNMLEKIAGKMHEEQKIDDLLGDFANVASKVHKIIEEQPDKVGEPKDFKEFLCKLGQKKPCQGSQMDEHIQSRNKLANEHLLLESSSNDGLHGRINSVIRGLEEKCAWTNEKLEEHASQVSSLKMHVDEWILKLASNDKNEYVTSEQMKSACESIRYDVERINDSKVEEFRAMKQEILSMFKDIEASVNRWKDSVLEEKLEEEILHIAEVFSERQESTTSELKQEVFQLKKDLNMIVRWKDEAQHLIATVCRYMEDLQRKDVSKGEEKRTVLQLSEFQKRTSCQLRIIRETLDKLMQNDAICKQEKSKLEASFSLKLNTLQRMIEKNVQDVSEKLSLLDKFEQHKRDFEGRWRYEREKERTQMMDKLETLSGLYLGGLDELRVSLSTLKAGFGNKIEELAKCLDSPSNLRLGIDHVPEQSTEVEAHMFVSNKFVEEASKRGPVNVCILKQSGFSTCLREDGNNHEPSARKSSAISILAPHGMPNLDVNFKVNTNTIPESIICRPKQDDHALCNMPAWLINESMILCEANLELQGIVQKARKMLDEIMDVKRQSTEFANELVKTSSNLKQRSQEYNLLASEDNDLTMIECSEKHRDSSCPAGGPAKSQTVCSSAVEVDGCRKKDDKCSESLDISVSSKVSGLDDFLSDMVSVRSKASQFIGQTAAELSALEDSKHNINGLLDANKSEERTKIQEAIQHIVKSLEQNEGLGIKNTLEKWESILDEDVSKARFLERELKEVKDRLSNMICLGNNFTQDLDQHLRKSKMLVLTEGATNEVKAEVISIPCDCQSTADIKQKQEIFKKDMDCLNEKVSNLSSLLDELRRNSRTSEQAELCAKQIFGSSQKMFDLGKKMVKLESLQLDVAFKLKEIQLQMKEFEMSTSDWSLKYDSATKVLNDLETRLRMIEGLLWQKTESAGHDLSNRKQLLYQGKEAVGVPIEQNSERIGGNSNSEKVNDDTLKQPENRMVTLESRIEHVASAAYANLRILDAKVQQISIGIQTALEGAAIAERKCNALGTELVKVFRNLARSSKGRCVNPNRMNDGRHSRCASRRPNVDNGVRGRGTMPQHHIKRSSLRSSLGNQCRESRILKMNRLCNTFQWS
ncbi:hypothetical protein KP509_02G054100 [Ceratopteris richardii]|uniref:Uncharacterized protein n=1 Tax=Ceratopteris richardii TaxID=49495 RepID=A0A8T2V607_CERRI|nr:hypothetical protein KP509_02G054100 [Ceratopteris richardii]KAH7443875.1 hypothetical protein KP509_02G054100 [Ceratopteris richardii]KAH7443877.1 hypothetical protein KP509_02G054100 [Ceratopteris richardii]